MKTSPGTDLTKVSFKLHSLLILETNSQKILRIKDDGTTEKTSSGKLRVGDLLLITEDTLFPSDLVLIESSSDGVGFIQTSSLDGEKNLKKRLQPKDFNIRLVPDGDKTDTPDHI